MAYQQSALASCSHHCHCFQAINPLIFNLWKELKSLWSRAKPWLSPLILGVILIFLGLAFYTHWQEVQDIRVSPTGWACLAIATGITLLAHIWTGWVWSWILAELEVKVDSVWAVQTYLITNIAKYLPGNVFHLYGRTLVATQTGIPLGTASVSVLLDTILMAAAALLVALLAVPREGLLLSSLALISALVLLHPRVLNPLLSWVGHRLGKKQLDGQLHLRVYPIRPFLGEIGFVLLRGSGFVLVVAALNPVDWQAVPLLLSIFSAGWLLGFITPGAPGGLGVFEVTAITLLNYASRLGISINFSPAMVLSVTALYRLSSTLAEALGAAWAWLDQRRRD